MQAKFDTLVTHERPHLDEITAIWLLKKFGEGKFPGVSEARVECSEFIGHDGGDHFSAGDCEKNGILLIGVGGGRFDEHPLPGQERKNGDCAATLVAKDLGINDDPSLEKIINFTLNNDLKGAGQPFDLAYLVKLLHQQNPNDPKKALEWAIMGLEAKYQEQLQFWTETKKQFEEVAKTEEIQGPGGKMVKMVTVVSDDEQISKFARSAYGGRAAIVIQKQSSGNVQIHTNKQFGLTLFDVTQMIRLAEQQAKGRVITTEWKTLSSEGKIVDAEEWFFSHPLQALFNGSLTAKSVPPTKLSLERIQGIIKIGINPNSFESKHVLKCEKGVCYSDRNHPCPWYPWGLHRCRLIRYQMKQKIKK